MSMLISSTSGIEDLSKEDPFVEEGCAEAMMDFFPVIFSVSFRKLWEEGERGELAKTEFP